MAFAYIIHISSISALLSDPPILSYLFRPDGRFVFFILLFIFAHVIPILFVSTLLTSVYASVFFGLLLVFLLITLVSDILLSTFASTSAIS